MKSKFEIGKTYRGSSGVGYISLKVIARTEKTIVVKSSFGENRLRINDKLSNTEEMGFFKSWIFGANDIYSEKKQIEDSYYQSYCL